MLAHVWALHYNAGSLYTKVGMHRHPSFYTYTHTHIHPPPNTLSLKRHCSQARKPLSGHASLPTIVQPHYQP
eukprot:scaffold31535_cov20-Tisochrysis_lutea.AAC.2